MYPMQYLDNTCVPTIVYYNFVYASLYVTRKVYFLIDSSFCTFEQSRRKGCTSSNIHIIKQLFLHEHNNPAE